MISIVAQYVANAFYRVVTRLTLCFQQLSSFIHIGVIILVRKPALRTGIYGYMFLHNNVIDDIDDIDVTLMRRKLFFNSTIKLKQAIADSVHLVSYQQNGEIVPFFYDFCRS